MDCSWIWYGCESVCVTEDQGVTELGVWPGESVFVCDGELERNWETKTKQGHGPWRTHLIIFHLYTDPLYQLLSSCCCVNMLWQDLQCATNTNTLSIPHMSTTPTLCQLSSHQLTHEHKTQIHTYLLWPSNSPEPEPSSQQRQSEWWIRARIRERSERQISKCMHCKMVSKLTRTLHSKNYAKGDVSSLFLLIRWWLLFKMTRSQIHLQYGTCVAGLCLRTVKVHYRYSG